MWKISGTNILGCDCDFDSADIVIFGAPFDSTTSFRPGTRFASKEIRGNSFGLEVYSPYQDKNIDDFNICDSGDLELCFGDVNAALADIEEYTGRIITVGKIPVMIGGEHLVTLGAVKAVQKKYSDLHIVHFDAHTDLREEYLGAALSHATVIRRCYDILGDNKIFQFGIRSGEKAEFEFAKKHNFIQLFNLSGIDEIISELQDKPVYFTLDLDVMDPSVFPGTGTPEPGGVTFSELLDAVIKVGRLNIVGCDVTELSPVYDTSGASTAAACKIIRELLISISAK
jgi:agmatinase